MGCSVLARDLDEQARLSLAADLDESELGLVAFTRSRGGRGGSGSFVKPVISHSSAWVDSSPAARCRLVRGADDVTRSGLSYATNVWAVCTRTLIPLAVDGLYSAWQDIRPTPIDFLNSSTQHEIQVPTEDGSQ